MPKCVLSEETSSYRGRLADVLRVWDCYEQAWREDAPVVFRFEKVDVLVWRTGEAGAVRSRFCTEAEEEEALRELEAQAVFSDSCLCWRAVPCKGCLLYTST